MYQFRLKHPHEIWSNPGFTAIVTVDWGLVDARLQCNKGDAATPHIETEVFNEFERARAEAFLEAGRDSPSLVRGILERYQCSIPARRRNWIPVDRQISHCVTLDMRLR